MAPKSFFGDAILSPFFFVIAENRFFKMLPGLNQVAVFFFFIAAFFLSPNVAEKVFFALNQIAVFVFVNRRKSWKKVAYGVKGLAP